MPRKWEYSRGTRATAVIEGTDHDRFNVITLIARIADRWEGDPSGSWSKGKYVKRLLWCSPSPRMRYRTGKTFHKFYVRTEAEAIELAKEGAELIGGVYVPNIDEGVPVRTLTEGLIEELAKLGE